MIYSNIERNNKNFVKSKFKKQLLVLDRIITPPIKYFAFSSIEKIKFMGYPCCPNKWNVYHECSLFCQNNWSSRNKSTGPEIDSEYAEIHKNSVEKYGPLPEDWQEKWDPGSGRHFYWCTRTGN